MYINYVRTSTKQLHTHTKHTHAITQQAQYFQLKTNFTLIDHHIPATYPVYTSNCIGHVAKNTAFTVAQGKHRFKRAQNEITESNED